MIDPLLPLITNLVTKNREYVIFVGAGFSKDAGVKSGWDILIETLKPLYIRENNLSALPEDYYLKIENWYLNHKTYRKLGYSDILELMYKGNIERREYLKQFFEKAYPGEAHRQLATMVANNFVRFIFTTNFDDLIEKALDEKSLDYDVIYSDDILSETKSWDKVKTCRIYKLHGDYKTGRVRNTINELKKLDSLISEDFQYIIDRHGLIIVGYAGRDEGIMNHFLKRKPYAYPFYWQCRETPTNNKEFKLYHTLIDKYKNEHKHEIQLIKFERASDFLAQISGGIENLERVLFISQNEQHNYRDYITHNDSKGIRKLTLELSNKFYTLYDEYRDKEGLDRSYKYRFEIFEKFLKEIVFIFQYIDDLLKFPMKDIKDEVTYFINNIINYITNIDWANTNEFIKKSSSYYIIMNWGALFLKNNYPELVNLFYNFKIQNGYRNYISLMSQISYESAGWKYIAKENYKMNYFFSKYAIIIEKLLPPLVSQNDFNHIDAYITFDWIRRSLDDMWVCGSHAFTEDFQEVYFKYFDPELNSKEKAMNFINKLSEKLPQGFRMDGTFGLSRAISNKYGFQ